MILVLLYRFCESQNSIVGFRLCEKLAQNGHEVLVTSTSNREERLNEVQVAKQLTEKYTGSIKVIEPESEELEEPSPEWIAKLHRTYFPQLQDRKDVRTVIGTLPGTSQTALALQEKLKCCLVLLATTKMTRNEESLKKEICRVASHADEVWSVGNDIFCHYDEIFRENDDDVGDKILHQEISLRPEVIEEWSRGTTVESNNLVTVWNNEHSFFFKGKEENVGGSSKESFFIISSALEKVSEEGKDRLEWNLHGLKDKEKTVKTFLGPKNLRMLQIHTHKTANVLANLKLEKCLAYIAP